MSKLVKVIFTSNIDGGMERDQMKNVSIFERYLSSSFNLIALGVRGHILVKG